MFGLFKTQLGIYNLSGKNDKNWFNRQFKKAGEAPVIFDSTLVYKTETDFKRFFVNKGYVDAEVSSSITRNKKKAEIKYNITGNQPYRIRTYETNIPDTAIFSVLYKEDGKPEKITGESASQRTPLVNTGMPFDRGLLDKERDRITKVLRNRGYYAFDKNYLTYDADSALLSNSVDLMLQLHLYPEILPSGTFVEMPHRKYYIDQVFIYTDYDPLRASIEGESYLVRDSIVNGKYTIYFPQKSPSIRPSVLMAHNYLSPGRLYAQVREETTYSAYSGLAALSNIQLRIEEKVRNDTAFLNCHILTMPAKKQSISFSIEGTNSAGDLGFASSIGYYHLNLFKGSEVFNIKLRGAYEAISENFSQNYLDLGVETAIRFPSFMFPLLPYSFRRSMRASTEFNLGYNYQTRPEYDRILVSGGLKYLWQSRSAGMAKHQFSLLDINYIYLPRISQSFIDKLPNKDAMLFGYTSQFIVGMGYTYSHSTFNPLQKQRNVYSLRGSLESAGNALYTLSNLLHSKKNAQGVYELFGIPYAQYVKGDIDYSKTIFIDKHNSIAWRIGTGVAYPYGNDLRIPFEKRYYSGGANSVRAWQVRTLGPGKFVSNNGESSIYDHSGDIKLDLNLEYRSKFFWKFELAAYVDAGNIWTIREYENQQGGYFRFDSFYKEIALGYGLGLRLDFDFFLIRLDTGLKAYNPEKDGKERWAILHPDFGENFAWHFAVGYPF